MGPLQLFYNVYTEVVCTNTGEFLYTFIKKIPDKYIWYNVRFSKNLVGTFTHSKNRVKNLCLLSKSAPHTLIHTKLVSYDLKNI